MKARFSSLSLLSLCVVTTLICAGCANMGRPSQADYKALFSQVIRKSLDKTSTNNVCLPPIFGLGPLASDSLEINSDDDIKTFVAPTGRLAQLKALESVGLMSGVEAERTVKGKDQKFLTFRRTEKGNSVFSNGSFCYARAEFDSLIKWKGPIKLGDYEAAWVYYTTKTTQIADWARSEAVIAAFPTVAPIVNGGSSKVRQVALDLSSEGWDIAEYSKLLLQ